MVHLRKFDINVFLNFFVLKTNKFSKKIRKKNLKKKFEIFFSIFFCLKKKYIRYEYEAPKKFNFYLLWLLRYDVHKFVPVHGIDEDEDAKNHLACNAVHEFYWLDKLYSAGIRSSQKN